MQGEIDVEAAIKRSVALVAGHTEPIIGSVREDRITPMPGGPKLAATMKRSGWYCALVSGCFTDFTESVAHGLGFHENRANRLEIIDGILTGGVIPPILGRAAKVDALKEISSRLGLQTSDVLAVGDGANDLGMIDLAGTGVALHAKPAVAAAADICINYGDLTALLFIQGYSRQQFAPPTL